MPLQIRRGTEAERAALTSVNGLVVGELLYVTDDQKLYIGNGTTPGGIVATSYNDNDAKAAAGSAITSGTHEYISFSYNSVSRTVNSTLDLSDYQGTIKASSFKGSILADDGSSIGGVTLVDATDASINLDGTVKGNIIPDLNITYDIGSNLLRFKDLYLSGSTIYLGNATITANGTAIDIPAGSTIGGVDIGNVAGGVSNTDIVADDSTVLVNVSTKAFTGNLTGSVFATTSATTLVDAANGKIVGPYDNSDLRITSNTITSDTGAIEFTSTTSGDGSRVIINFESGEYSSGLLSSTGVQRLDLRTIGGTYASPVDLVAGDVLSSIGFVAIQSSTSTESISGIGVVVDSNGTVSSTHVPTKMFMFTQPATAGLPNLLTFDTRGYLAVGQENASATLDVNGFAKLAVLSAAPAGPANGMIAIADGSGWDPLGLGAPAKQQMVVYLGGGWRSIAQEP